MRSESRYQSVLIALGIVATLLFGIFFYREVFPEYLLYQDAFVALEEFRSTYTHEPASPFKKGVKQILLEREDKGPPIIDRCITCHVALEIEAFSATRIAKDSNGNIVYDAAGIPAKEENPDYVFKKLDDVATTDPRYEALNKAQVGHTSYDMRKVLVMHPLIGRETRPFENHPLNDYGCTSCHGGNGRGLVTDRAHGPVFDGHYEEEYRGFVPKFLEEDPKNDPAFAHVFNAKPGHRLLFQTTPLYVGVLIQAKCIQCHQGSSNTLSNAAESTNTILKRKEKEILAIQKGLELEKQNIASLLYIRDLLEKRGYQETVRQMEQQSEDYTQPITTQEALAYQVKFLKNLSSETALYTISQKLLLALGSEDKLTIFVKEFKPQEPLLSIEKTIPRFKNETSGSLFAKLNALQETRTLLEHVKDVSSSFTGFFKDEMELGKLKTDIDLSTKDYQYGQELFLTQGCYACHRIAGFSRGGVGPEVTLSGLNYPWYIKESIVWPQADLHTSTMPNMQIDHEELEALVTFLLGQTGKQKAVAETGRKLALQEWEAGKKLPWEQPITSKEIFDPQFGMKVFALEGCASCHRLEGYKSNVGFAIERNKPTVEDLQNEKRWFQALFPEQILGSEIVQVIDAHQDEIDRRIVENVRQGSLLEEIEDTHPHFIEALYSPFKFALRAKNHLGEKTATPWKERIHRVLKTFVQVYGLGRLICPKPNWSGVYRSDQWLMEHFKNPSSHVPRSIMPVFPFDDTKFMALTYMLNTLAQENVKGEREVWKVEGFKPEEVYLTHCAQCHGTNRQGNGPVAEWLYPLPKNLTNPEFLRNLTREKVFESIMHGVPGTPMPAWGELGADKLVKTNVPVFTEAEIHQLVDWIFSSLPGGTVIRNEKEVPKWNYQPEEVMKELKNEGQTLDSEIFDKLGNSYLIKDKYFTTKNIESGRHLFILNCAPCHGTEADGAGLRAEVMSDAKPRMLTNLDWISSRDDLRLLRSIKYGVPGTAMTPWGDLTNSLQRLQMVIYIRSLTEIPKTRRLLNTALYQTFDESELLLEKNSYTAILPLLKKQKALFATLSNNFVNLEAPHEILQPWLDLIQLYQKSNQWNEGKLTLVPFPSEDIKNKLLLQMDQQIEKNLLAKERVEKNEESATQKLEINTINDKITAWKKLKVAWLTGIAEVERLQKEKEKLVNSQ